MAVFMFGRGTPSKIAPVFSDNSWELIAKACQMNKVPDSWVVGDYKNMTINDKEYLVVIIAKNHDIYSDGTGTAPLTLQLIDCYETRYRMASAQSNKVGWTNSEMRTVTLPAIMALMPIEVQEGIRAVNKMSSAGNRSSTINTTADKLFLVSEVEVFGTTTYAAPGEGTRYQYYTQGVKRLKNLSGSAISWWLRSPAVEFDTTFCEVRDQGFIATSYSNEVSGVCPAFCF